MNYLEENIQQLWDLENAKYHASQRWKTARQRTSDPMMISLFGSGKLNHEEEITRLANIRWQERLLKKSIEIAKHNMQQLKYLKNE